MALFTPIKCSRKGHKEECCKDNFRSSRKHRPDKRRQAEAMTATFRMKAPGRLQLCIGPLASCSAHYDIPKGTVALHNRLWRQSKIITTAFIGINYRSSATPFPCLATKPPEGEMRAGIIPGFPALDKSNREAGFGFKLRTFWDYVSRNEITDQRVRGSNPTRSASRLPLSGLGQPGSIRAIILPSGGMEAGHRKGVTDERFPPAILIE
ncbi:hypothetical protein T265_04477 [Opisthorchis viverrini]|uniref:Uncharacterized protein n=1 Tax=Opisthorchis viverrini TaxID=6198 RepID=A0A075AGJ7_OPIVI|nr:hypothetical protein T265_04477 [Opisthorchis viverrini]KER28789.1 hypothetical protein T265_04477 [Opisthorchis viverrini]